MNTAKAKELLQEIRHVIDAGESTLEKIEQFLREAGEPLMFVKAERSRFRAMRQLERIFAAMIDAHNAQTANGQRSRFNSTFSHN